jgi:arabinan endo-1,5-alpha-L-arabinosidase
VSLYDKGMAKLMNGIASQQRFFSTINFAFVAIWLTFSLVPAASSLSAQQALTLDGDVAFAHDPSIARDGNTYYVFATGKAPGGGQLPLRCSADLTHWKFCGHVFNEIPQWIRERSPGTTELWAPDISFEHGVYRLYYAYSLFGKNTSGIALATNKTLDPTSPKYRWIDKGLVLESSASDAYNAIDPNYVQDAKGRAWLAFGSFWSGIKMRALDAETGMLSTTDTELYSLAARARPAESVSARPGLPPDWQAVEAPFVFSHGSFYYLFVSWGLCCRGTRSTYRTMVGRSRSVTGPYVDELGIPMMDGGGTQVLAANNNWVGPGGESVLQMKDGTDLLVFHAYDAVTGRPALQISTIAWRNDWPRAALQNH